MHHGAPRNSACRSPSLSPCTRAGWLHRGCVRGFGRTGALAVMTHLQQGYERRGRVVRVHIGRGRDPKVALAWHDDAEHGHLARAGCQAGLTKVRSLLGNRPGARTRGRSGPAQGSRETPSCHPGSTAEPAARSTGTLHRECSRHAYGHRLSSARVISTKMGVYQTLGPRACQENRGAGYQLEPIRALGDSNDVLEEERRAPASAAPPYVVTLIRGGHAHDRVVAVCVSK